MSELIVDLAVRNERTPIIGSQRTRANDLAANARQIVDGRNPGAELERTRSATWPGRDFQEDEKGGLAWYERNRYESSSVSSVTQKPANRSKRIESLSSSRTLNLVRLYSALQCIRLSSDPHQSPRDIQTNTRMLEQDLQAPATLPSFEGDLRLIVRVSGQIIRVPKRGCEPTVADVLDALGAMFGCTCRGIRWRGVCACPRMGSLLGGIDVLTWWSNSTLHRHLQVSPPSPDTMRYDHD